MPEQTIFSIKPSIRPLIPLYILAALLFIIPMWLGNIYFAAIPIAALAAIFFAKHLKIIFTKYTLDSRNITIRTGLLSKKQQMIPLVRVQNISFKYSIWQRILGIGDVLVESAAEQRSGIKFKNVENPEALSKKILEAAGQAHSNSGPFAG